MSAVAAVDPVYARLAETLGRWSRQHGPGLIVGLSGAQGAGKSTLTAALSERLTAEGLRVAALSLDDVYFTLAERQALGREVHPLLATRGPPGTHDLALAARVLDSLRGPGPTAIPRFDKATDDRHPRVAWDVLAGPADVILLEGWCVGARAELPAALVEPINALELTRDPDGVWRRCVNAALAGDYQRLFARIDQLVLLQAPGFDVVLAWRLQQEHALRDRLRAGGAPGRAMSDAQVATFVSLYERTTRRMLADLPARADVVIGLAEDRTPTWLGG